MYRFESNLTLEFARELLLSHGHDKEAGRLTLQCAEEAVVRRAKAEAGGTKSPLLPWLLEVVREEGEG